MSSAPDHSSPRSSARLSLKRDRSPDSPTDAPLSHTHSKRQKLTHENLRRHSRLMADSREPRGRSMQTMSTPTSRSKSRVTTTDVAFHRSLITNGVFVEDVDPPANLDEMRTHLTAARQSASPTQTEFEDYCQRAKCVKDESGVVQSLIPRIAKVQPPNYTRSEISWARVHTAVTTGISAPKPDFAEYRHSGEQDVPVPALNSLEDSLLPTTNDYYMMPSFIAHVKGPGLTSDKANYQSAYDGAVMVEREMAVDAYTGQDHKFGTATALTARTNGKEFVFDAHFARRSDQGVTFHRAQVVDAYPTRSLEEMKTARRAFRNAQDFSYNHSDEIIQRVNAAPAQVPPNALPTPGVSSSGGPAFRSHDNTSILSEHDYGGEHDDAPGATALDPRKRKSQSKSRPDDRARKSRGGQQ